jgi:phage-related protein
MPLEYTITIPEADHDTITGNLSGGDIEYTFDRGVGRDSSARILSVSFGDGYEQRVVDGLNAIEENLQVGFNNRDYVEINILRAFFELKNGVDNFTVKITNTTDDTNPVTDTTQTMKFTCAQWNVIYGHSTNHSLNAQFKRVYEP